MHRLCAPEPFHVLSTTCSIRELCDDRHSSEPFGAQRYGDRMTSGRTAPVAGDSIRKRWPFVGRNVEMEGIVATFDDPGTLGVVIHGAPGVGKTRLAEEVLAAAEAEDRWCVRAVASERTRQVPLGAVAHLLPARILLDRSDPLTLFPKVAETVKARGKGRRVVLLIDDLQLLDSTTSTLT